MNTDFVLRGRSRPIDQSTVYVADGSLCPLPVDSDDPVRAADRSEILQAGYRRDEALPHRGGCDNFDRCPPTIGVKNADVTLIAVRE